MRVVPFLDMTNYPHEMRNYLRKGECGCFESHMRAWELCEDGGCYVMEDDAQLQPHVFEHISEFIGDKTDDPIIVMARYSQPKRVSAIL